MGFEITQEQFNEIVKKLNSIYEQREEEKKLSVEKTMDANGRITIPKSIRQILGWDKETNVEIEVYGKNILIKRVDK